MRELLFDVANARSIGDLGAGVFEHVIHVETEAIGRRRDPRIDDAQAQLVEEGSGARKAVLGLRRVCRDSGAAASGELLHGHERALLGRIAFRPTWNPWADVGMRRCTAQPNLGLAFYDEDDWFSKHTRHDFTDFGVAPTFDCE